MGNRSRFCRSRFAATRHAYGARLNHDEFYNGAQLPYNKFYNYSESFYVGIPTPESITGPANLCPGQTATYSTNAKLFGATGFTWTVPSGWYVNGIPGPSVSGQGASVSITNNGTEINDYKIGVKGTSETCGSSKEFVKMVTVGYSYDIDAKNIGGGAVSIIVRGPEAASYSWTFTPGWTVISNSGKSVEVNPNGIAGYAKVTVVDPCGRSHDYYYYYTPGACNATMSLYPTAVVQYMYFDPGTATITSIKITDLNGTNYTLPYNIENGIYYFNTLSLPYGTYIFSTKDTSGCLSQMRFTRTEY